MIFAEKLENLRQELGISQLKISELTGIGKSSISQYLSGKNEPPEEKKRKIAIALGVQEDYFHQPRPTAEISQNECINLTPEIAAKLMHKSKEFVCRGLQEGIFPWGYAVKMKKWNYFISSVKFTEYTGIKIPMK